MNGTTGFARYSGLSWKGGNPDGDNITYDIYLGTTTPPPLVIENQTGTYYYPGTLNYSTKYYWQIVAWDVHGASTTGPIWSFTASGMNRPPFPPEIFIQKVNHTTYNIIIRSTDPDRDDIFYFIDWGDGTFIDWLGLYKSGENVTITHSLPSVTKLYEIHIKAKDIFGAESNWVTVYIFILKSRLTSFHWFFGY